LKKQKKSCGDFAIVVAIKVLKPPKKIEKNGDPATGRSSNKKQTELQKEDDEKSKT
jgi:hypothetical protein